MANMAWYDTAQLPKIEAARESSDWLTAILLSAIQLERHGYLAIRDHLESLKVDSNCTSQVLENLHLPQMALFLLVVQKISIEEYNTILTINAERNKFLHRRETKKYALGREADKKYAPLVNEAIRILKERFNVMRLFVSRT